MKAGIKVLARTDALKRWREIGTLTEAATATGRSAMRRVPSALPRTVSVIILLVSWLLAFSAAAAQSAGDIKKNFEQLVARMQSAYQQRDQVEYVAALARIAREYPPLLDALVPRAINMASSSVWKSRASPDAMYGMYAALFAANYRQDGIESPDLQRRFIRLLIEREEWSKAQEIARRIRSPRVALELMADRRGDPLVQANPAIFDIDAQIELQIRELEAATKRYPQRLSTWIALLYAYRDAGRYRQILAVSDELLAGVARAGSAEKQFEDAEKLNWIHDHRAYAWRGLGDWAAAEREHRLAADLPENGRANISNALNLASFLALKGSGGAALEVLAAVSKDSASVSEYGRVTEMSVRHIAALSSRNQAAAVEALEYLRANRKVSREALLEGLIREGKFDEATREYVQWLKDPEARWEALVFVQDYTGPAQRLPSQQAYARNFKAWVGREDVRAATYNVGRIGRVSMISRSALD